MITKGNGESLPSSVTIRRAIPAEAPALATLADALFRQGYGATHPEPELSRYVARCFSAEAFARDLTDPSVTVLVADEGPTGPLAGYAILRDGSPASSLTSLAAEPGTEGVGPNDPPPDAGKDPIEILRFYVDQKWHGSGVAQALMTECALEAGRRGGDVLWLQAWQQAARALAFYKKMGFAVLGTAKFKFGERIDDDFLLARRVAADR